MLGLELTQSRLTAASAEFIGTLVLALIVVGSGLQGPALSGDTTSGLMLNIAATAASLWVLISLFAPVSGAHFNPVVSLAACWRGEISRLTATIYLISQALGALLGVALANLMYLEQPLVWSSNLRANSGTLLSELVATVGLLLVILVFAARQHSKVAIGVALWIAAAALATSSTAFANPALSLSRIFAADGAGIDPLSAIAFSIVQFSAIPIALLALRVFSSSTQNQRR